jgi:uncharacterized protein
MEFETPPVTAAWVHEEARSGFEVAFFEEDHGLGIDGCTTAVEAGQSWIVSYRIMLDSSWRTRWAHVSSRSVSGGRTVELSADGSGHWSVDGMPAPELDGCLDVDLESSALTNAFPVHRMGLSVGSASEAPAAYVRALGLSVERLEQHYTRLPDDGPRQRYDYLSPAFDFRCELVYDESGFVLTYPGIARRVRG